MINAGLVHATQDTLCISAAKRGSSHNTRCFEEGQELLERLQKAERT